MKATIRSLGISVFLLAALGTTGSRAKDNNSSLLLGTVGEGTVDSPVGSAGPDLEIRANKDASNAAIKIGQTISEGSKFSILTLTASAPVNKADDTTSLASFDGFANAASLELKYTQFDGPHQSPDRPAMKETLAAVQAAIVKGALAKGKTAEEAAQLEMSDDTIAEYAPDQRAAFKSLFWDPTKHLSVWGISGKIGYQEHKYLDVPALTEGTTTKMPYSGKIFWGFVPTNSETLVTFSFEYQVAFKDAKSQSFAAPPDSNGLQEVKTGPIGPPANDDKQLLSIEIRRYLGGGGKKKSIGLSLVTIYDFKSNEFSAKMPIWLYRSDKNALSGGFQLSWDGKNDKFNVSLIVGSGFGIFR